MKKPLAERIAAAEERKAQMVARLAALKGKAKAVDRKLDTRRKIVVGAAVLVEIEREPRFAEYVRKMLEKAVTRTQDKEAIADLLTTGVVKVRLPSANTNTQPAPPAAADAPVMPGSQLST